MYASHALAQPSPKRRSGRRAVPPVDFTKVRATASLIATELRQLIVDLGRQCPLERTQRHRVFDLSPERMKRSTLDDAAFALAMVAHTPNVPEQIGAECESRMVRIARHVRPLAAGCVLTTLRAETTVQGTTDVAQLDGMLAAERNDRLGVRRAIEACYAHRRALDANIADLEAEERRIEALSAPSLILSTGGRHS